MENYLVKIPKEFHLLCVAVGIALMIMGLYFNKTYYELAGLAFLCMGLIISFYVWWEERKPKFAPLK